MNDANTQSPTHYTTQKLKISEFRKLLWVARPFLNKRDLTENDEQNIEELILKLKELEHPLSLNDEKDAEKLLLKLEEKLHANDSEDMKNFRKLTAELEKDLDEKEFLSKRKSYQQIIRRIRKLTPIVPVRMVTHAAQIIMKYAQKLELFNRRKRASKTLWKIEEKLQQEIISSKEISKLMQDLIKSEKFYGCKYNRIELQRIDVLKMRITNALSHVYVMEEIARLIEDEVRFFEKFF